MPDCDHCGSPSVKNDGIDNLCKGCDVLVNTPEIDTDWLNERAMQSGMAFGSQGYNDEMGY